MEYYLQFGNTDTEVADYKANRRTTLSDSRMFLDGRQHQRAEPIQTFEAPNWLSARDVVEEFRTDLDGLSS